MKRLFPIIKRELIENLSLKKTLIYIALTVLTTILILKFTFLSQAYTNLIDFRASLFGGLFLIYFILVCGIFLSSFLGILSISSISKEFSEGTILLLVTRPIKRKHIIIAKIAALTIYGFIISTFSILLITSILGLLGVVDSGTFWGIFKVGLVFIFYSLILSFLTVSFCTALALVVNRPIACTAILFILIILTFFLPILVSFIFTAQPKMPQNILLGSLASNIAEGIGIKIFPLAKIIFGRMTALFKEINIGDIMPIHVNEAMATINMPAILSLVLILIITAAFIALAIIWFNRKEIY
ncbi:MAG: ABC transporter permease [Candidatus Pacearchaeota archaeon]